MYHVRERGATIGGQLLLLNPQITITTDGDPEFGLVKAGILKASGVVKKALRRNVNVKNQWPFGVHEIETLDGSYVGWGWWDELLLDREVYVCPVVEYSLKFEGYVDWACLLLSKVGDTTYRRCGRARVRNPFFDGCEFGPICIE